MVSNTLRDARLTRSWSSADKVYPLLVDVRSGEANDETTAPSNNADAAGVATAQPTTAPARATSARVAAESPTNSNAATSGNQALAPSSGKQFLKSAMDICSPARLTMLLVLC